MASLEKNKPERSSKSRPSTSKIKKSATGIPDIENPEQEDDTSVKTKPASSLPGSVISVKDAEETAKTETVQDDKDNEPKEAALKGRPPSGKPATTTTPTAAFLASSAKPQTDDKPPSPVEATPGQLPRAASAVSLKSIGKKNTVEPVNVPGSNMGSAVSLQSRASREAWSGGDVKATDPPSRPASATKTRSRPASPQERPASVQSRPISAQSRPASAVPKQSRPASAATSVISVNEASSKNRVGEEITKEQKPVEIIPPDMNEAHAYIPYTYARDCIAKMMEDMKKMKRKHITIITDIEENYQHIEHETQKQFNTFVIGLRQQYGSKVKTFRQVIEVHRTELQQKQQHWDESLTSLSNKNKMLLQDKKALLIQNKLDAENMEKQKDDGLRDLVTQLDERTKAFGIFEKEKEEEVGVLISAKESEYKEQKTNMDKEQGEFKQQCEEEVIRLQGENKILEDELENEKGERMRLEEIIEDLKKRPDTAAAVTAAVVFKTRSKTPIKEKKEEQLQSAVVVTDMSADERKKMDEERKEMEFEREEMKRDRERTEKERDDFVTERNHFQEERVIIQGEIIEHKKEREVLKIKYDDLKASLDNNDDWKKRYEILLAQYEAVTTVAQVNTKEEKSKAEEEIEKADKDKVLIEEEQHKLQEEIKQWEKDFKQQQGRPPTEEDRNDSAKEMHASLDEATSMVTKLQAQVVALEAIKRGEIPPPPKVEKETITIKETEVKTVEIKVPDPELLAYVEMTQAELEAMKRQLTALKNDKTQLKSDNSKLQAEISHLQGQIGTVEATNKELEERLRQALSEMEALKNQLKQADVEPVQTSADKGDIPVVKVTQMPVTAAAPPAEPLKAPVQMVNKSTQTECVAKPVTKSSQTDPLPLVASPQTSDGVEPVVSAAPPVPVPVVDTEELQALEKQVRDKDKEIRELELTHKDAMRSLEKEKNSMEKDLKKVLKALAKAQKEGASKEDKKLRNLLDIVVAQVCEINGQVNKAAQEVDKRLKNANSVQDRSKEMQEKAKQQFSDWELGWAEENGKEPVLEDVQSDKSAHKMYKVLKAANKKSDEDDMLVEALTLIKTGALPEKQDQEVPEKETALTLAAKPVASTPECNHEEEIEKLEATVSDQEKRIDELEDKVRDLEKQRDLLNNENQDLEDRIADLLAEIEKLKGQVEFHKNKSQELYKQIKEQHLQHECLRMAILELYRQMEEQRLQHEQELREKEREHECHLQEKEEEFQKEKNEMEKDIRKLVKLIDKLKRKMQQKVRDAEQPKSELEALLEEKDAELDELDDRVSELEDQLADLDADKHQLIQANKKLEEKIGDLETVVTKTETRVTELGVAAGATSTAEQEAEKLREDLQALRNKIKELEQELRAKNKELRELEYEHEKQMRDKERENKEMKSDIEKLIKVMDKQQKKIKDDKKEIDSLGKEIRDLENDCRAKDNEIDELIEKLNTGEKELATRANKKAEKTAEEDYEEIITELKTKVTVMEEKADSNENKAHDWQADYNKTKVYNQELEQQVDELQGELSQAQNELADLQMAAGAAPMLDRANDDISELRARVRTLEGDLRSSEKEVKEHEITMKEKTQEHERALREKEMLEREMKSDMKKLMKEIEKLQKKLKKRERPDLSVVTERDEEVSTLEKSLEKLEDKAQELEYKVADLQTDKKHLQKDVTTLEQENQKLEDKVFQLREELDQEREKLTQFDMQPITSGTVLPVAASTPTIAAQAQADVETIRELNSQIESLQKQLDQAQNDHMNEKSAHGVTKDELQQLKNKLSSLQTDLDNHKHESVAALEALSEKKDTEQDNLKRKQSEMRKRIQELEQQQQKALPPDAVKEIKQLQDKLAAAEKEIDNKEVEKADLGSKVRELIAKTKSLENTSKNQKSSNSDTEIKMKHLRQEKDREIKTIQAQGDRKERERALQERKKLAALEQQIHELQSGAPRGAAKEKPTQGKVDNKALKDTQDKLREAKKEISDLNAHIKILQKGADKPNNAEAERNLKKQEKLSQELMKKLDDAQKKNKKNEENLRQQENDLKQLGKENTAKDGEIAKLRAELESLGVAAKAGLEAENKRKELEKDVKKLKEENKTINDSWNQERVLRKKYYNMVEDMKGKIRVYARVRPMSKTELNNGNKEVSKSPDEYTIQLDTQRGMKEWQFDQIFMPASTQEKVFEDTNNLVQSAVDGYNVCIFAYGQTGSGKTFTIIGDGEQRLPGIAPRAFNRIFDLLDENKAKFKYSVECYMLELYNDKLLDLFAKPGTSSDEKLEIKKDKKGLVFIQGSEIKSARNSKELFALFEEGSKTRHTASTKMNSESSRSHLVIGITIETTNRATGQVLKGKLSLVDLAGSERAAKTNASAEQLKEAMSINKSLSALGDVISALSSEQSFIPYRNNKLTMLMQDSLGGNAKTLMFVNISPADYNADESAISLTYASRVKLITNDAQKNSDNKEIARLRLIVNKLKKGEAVVEEEET